VSKGPGIAQTKQLQKKHSHKAMEVLQVFQESDARTALSNIIVAMGDLWKLEMNWKLISSCW